MDRARPDAGVFGLVLLALPLRTYRGLLPVGLAFAVLAAVLTYANFDVSANFARLGATSLLGWWFLGYFETLAWVVLVACIIPWVDAYSVWRGPTKEIVAHHQHVFTCSRSRSPIPGEHAAANLGVPDLLFFALFLGAADRFGLRVDWTWVDARRSPRRDDRSHRLVESERAAGAPRDLARLPAPERRPALARLRRQPRPGDGAM